MYILVAGAGLVGSGLAERLADAKHDHQALFVNFLNQAEEYEDFGQFVGDLESAAWKFTEQVAKASWKNGVIKGEQRRA